MTGAVPAGDSPEVRSDPPTLTPSKEDVSDETTRTTDTALDPRTRDLIVLRATLARELDTINEYERMVHQAGSAEVKRLLAHLRDEEKEHVAECMEYIRRLDAVQDGLFSVDIEAHVAGAPRSAAKASPRPPGLTVGSLKKR